MTSALTTDLTCPYRGCYLKFTRAKELRRHKRHTLEHDYCKYCDQDFQSWDELKLHNIAMDEEGDDNHIVCHQCGDKFRIRESRDAHEIARHQMEHNIECKACKKKFTKPSQLVYHLEEGYCKEITSGGFISHVQHKFIIAAYLRDPQKLAELTGKSFRDAVQDEIDDGGVALGFTAAERDVNLIDFIEPINIDRKGGLPVPEQKWPTLGDAAINLKDGRSDASVRLPGTQLAAQPRNITLSQTAGASSLETSPSAYRLNAAQANNKDNEVGNAWAAGKTASSTLFANAKPTPFTLEQREMALRRDAEEANKNNILHHQFWNPDSDDYSVEKFYHPVLETYGCPIPVCNASFKAPRDLTHHINTEHRVIEVCCPVCNKSFQKYHDMVAHLESGSKKCGIINNDEKFNKVMDQFTGGFVTVTEGPKGKEYSGALPAGLNLQLKKVTVGGRQIEEHADREQTSSNFW